MDNDNLNDAPSISQKEIMKNNIKKECKKILEKYFEDREYNENKVNLWKEYCLEEIIKFLSSNHKEFGFVILIIITHLTEFSGSYRSNCLDISRNKTDSCISEEIQTKTMYIGLRIIFFKIYYSKINYIENIEENIFLKINDILTKNLENKKYSDEIASTYSKKIVNDLSTFLLEKKSKPCCFFQCNIIQKPINIILDYKIINFKYMPLMASYSNDSLYGQLILFILNN